MNMAKNKLFDLVLIGAALLLLAGAGLVWYHFQQTAGEVAVTVQRQQAELQEASQKIKLLHALRAKTGELEQEQRWLATFLPNDEGQAQFIEELESLAERSGVEVVSCTLDNTPKHLKAFPNYPIYQWKLGLDGGYPGMLAFLRELPNSERCIGIPEVKLTSAASGTAQDKAALHMECTLDLVTTAAVEKVKP